MLLQSSGLAYLRSSHQPLRHLSDWSLTVFRTGCKKPGPGSSPVRKHSEIHKHANLGHLSHAARAFAECSDAWRQGENTCHLSSVIYAGYVLYASGRYTDMQIPKMTAEVRLTLRIPVQELEQLRAAAQALKQDVDFLRGNQEKQRKQEESLVLGQLKKTVQALQAEGAAINEQQEAVRCNLLSWSLQQQRVCGQERAAQPLTLCHSFSMYHRGCPSGQGCLCSCKLRTSECTAGGNVGDQPGFRPC